MTRDADSPEAPRKFMTRTFLARMIAILLFVALGTFAVFQSIQGDLKEAALASSSSDPPVSGDASTEAQKTVDATALTAALNATPEPVNSPLIQKSQFTSGTQSSPAAQPATPAPIQPGSTPAGLPRFNPNATPANPVTTSSAMTSSAAQDKPAVLPPANQPAKPNLPAMQPASAASRNPASANPATLGQPAIAPPSRANPALPELARPAQQPGFAPGTVQVPATFPPAADKPAANSATDLAGKAMAGLASTANQVQQQAGDALDNVGSPLAERGDQAPAWSVQPGSDAAQLLQQAAGQPATNNQPASSPANNTILAPTTQSATNGSGSMLPPASFSPGQSGAAIQPATGINLQNAQPGRPNQLPGQPAAAPLAGLPSNGFVTNNQAPGATNPPGTRPGAIPTAPASTPLNQPGFETGPAQPGRTLVPGAVPQPVRTLATPGEARLEGTQTPSLAVEKQAPREIQLNQPAEFRIIVRNTGRVPASDVRVFDSVPAGTRLISSDPRHESAGTPDGLMWPLGDLQPGDEKTITLQLKPERPGEIGSVAHVTFATQASMRTRVTQPKISVEHTAPAQVMIGEPVPLQITVRNNGDGPATNVVIQEKVPEQLRYSEGIRDLEYEIGTLAPGQSRAVTLTLQAIAVGATRNIVGAAADGGLQTSHETPIEVVSPKLVATCDGPNRRFLKRSAAHAFTVQNSGTASATNVELITKLPRNVRFVSANNQGQYDPGSHAVYWSLAELRAGQSATVELESEPVETGAAQLEFVARADLNQQTAVQHPLTIEHLVDVHFEIEDLTDHIEVGAVTEYRLRLVNQGTRPASNVRLRAELAEGLRAEAVSGGLRGTANGQEVLFEPIPNINPGEEITAIFSAIGTAPGEHRVAVNLQTDGREINITKEESTRVYADQ